MSTRKRVRSPGKTRRAVLPVDGAEIQNGLDNPEPVLAGDPVGQGDGGWPGADVPYIGTQGLRHTFATLALIGGVSPHAVTAALGHHDVAFTLRTYAHLLPGMHSEAMNAIGNLIFGPPTTKNVTRSVT